MDTDIPDALFRINRNIMECKDTWHSDSKFRGWVLIETLWNVK